MAANLLDFWAPIFETDYEPFRPQCLGAESYFNEDRFYRVEQGGQLAATCHLTTPLDRPELGGLGEVATAPLRRGQGLAGRLCLAARDDFLAAGGQALFLGTINPHAARIYHRLGWRKLPGATVWALIASGAAPEVFLVDYFRAGGQGGQIAPGSPAGRVPMIPLIVAPHDWRVLDANVALYSTRYFEQNSCMSLYPRYARLIEEEGGAWFAARSAEGQLVGLASARTDGPDTCQLDGFVHARYDEAWADLLGAAIDWAAGRRCWARICVEDEDKRSRFEELGFGATGASEPFVWGDRTVAAVRLEKA